MGTSLGALVLAVVGLVFVFGNSLLNRYGKEKAERAFAELVPGSRLQIGELEYSAGANRLIAQSATLRTTDMTLEVGRISLTGVRWMQLLRGTSAPADILAQAVLEATDLDMKFTRARYGVRCARLRGSGPDAELIAEGAELRPLIGDEEFFAAREFRTTRFQVIVPECRVSGLAYGELLRKESYRAKSIHFSRPSFDALVNSDKPPVSGKNPLMVHETLAAIRRPLCLGSLTVTEGRIRYGERPIAGSAPGVLTFGAVIFSADGIANQGEPAVAIQIRAQGDLMNTGTMKVRLSIPIAPPDFSLHCSGSLGAMDLSRLSPFLDVVERLRIKSGLAKNAAFEFDVADGRARGQVSATYKDLTIAVLDEQSGNERGFASFLANLFKIRYANATNASGTTKQRPIDYTRKPGDTFLGFLWAALRSGLLDVIGH